MRITHLLDRRTDRLSGGEMQRVSIGRAIVREPRVFLMDEPLSNLDAKLRELLRAELKGLQQRLGTTLIFVTHDQVEAMTMGDRIGVVNKGELVQVGTPHEIYNAPKNTFVASFVGTPAINLLDVQVDLAPGTARDGALGFALDAGHARAADTACCQPTGACGSASGPRTWARRRRRHGRHDLRRRDTTAPRSSRSSRRAATDAARDDAGQTPTVAVEPTSADSHSRRTSCTSSTRRAAENLSPL